MARITVEDCVTRVPNRFELVMLAAQRARDVSAGASLTVDRDNDKNPVVALREIAEGTVELDHLRYELIHGLRRHVEIEDQPDDDLMMAYQDHPLVEPLRRAGAARRRFGHRRLRQLAAADVGRRSELRIANRRLPRAPEPARVRSAQGAAAERSSSAGAGPAAADAAVRAGRAGQGL